MYEKAQSIGIPAEFVILNGASHAIDFGVGSDSADSSLSEASEKMVEFVKNYTAVTESADENRS